MSRFRLFFNRISTLLGLFIIAVMLATWIDLNTPSVAQLIIKSPGLTLPKTSPTPVPTPGEVVVPIPVPLPKNPLPKTSSTPINNAGRSLTLAERDRMVAYLRSNNINQAPVSSLTTDPRFILHDTSVILPPSALERERRWGRGPLGLGVSAYLPRDSGAVIARPNFYELRRPTTTEFEKASDIMGIVDRERLFRQVWRSTNSNARRQGLDTALANLGLSTSEISAEQKGASDKLSAANGRIYTTATWTIESICSRYNSGDKSISISPQGSDNLRSACGSLTNYFNIRDSRVKSSVPVEIIQVGSNSERGNQNTCDANNSNIATLPNPAYSENQYDRTLALYFRAALSAGKFPQMTTHFVLDTFDASGHCDPRCFNLTKLYQKSAAVMGHPIGSSYGIKPSYGTQTGVNNIWWNDNICHSLAP